MTLVNIDKLKLLLLALKAEIEGIDVIAQSSTATVTLDQSSVGRLSRMDAMQGQQMALESARRRKQQAIQIHAALLRIENKTYGYCIDCDEEIVFGRLEINPVVTRCVHCSQRAG